MFNKQQAKDYFAINKTLKTSKEELMQSK